MPGTVVLAVGLVAAAFVAVTVGGSSAGVAFGPATGAGAVGPRRGAALLTVAAAVGGLTLGPRVTRTLGERFVAGEVLTLEAAVVVLAVTGVGILLGNLAGVSVSTSGTAVGAVVGLGVAAGAVRWATVTRVVGWWLLSAVVAFWVAALAGRYAYRAMTARLRRRSSARTRRWALVAGGCGMAFAAGGSNAANAVGALVGADALAMRPGLVLACAGMGVGAVVFGPRTMRTVGERITDLPVEGALLVQAVAATVITALNVAGVPASLAVTTTMAVVGLGWGRATRVVDGEAEDTGAAGAGDERGVGAVDHGSGRGVADLYDADVTGRVVSAWVASPVVAGTLAFGAALALGGPT